MKFKELKIKSITELQKILAESREQLRDLRFKVASKQLKNVREIREIRKRIVRILFILNQPKTEEPKSEARVAEDKKIN